MPRIKKPRRASLDEVRISREGDVAVIENADPLVGSVRLTIGPQLHDMTDTQILAMFNDIIEVQEESLNAHDNTVIEIPVGKPQIQFHEDCDQWTPVGDVLRCVIDTGDEGEAAIWIDDKELSLREFGRLLTTFAGWGMRIAFVPEEFVTDEPIVEIRQPDKGER